MSLFDPGDQVAIASAGYPCYRNILKSLGCELCTVPINSRYKITAKELDEYRQSGKGKKLKGLILSSPSNPTGSMLTREEVKGLCEYCKANDLFFISDEIYHGISYGEEEASAAEYMEGNDNILVVNSFSKYYSMTVISLLFISLFILPSGLYELPPSAITGVAHREN